MNRYVLFVAFITVIAFAGYRHIMADFSKTESTFYINADILTIDEGQLEAQATFIEDGIIDTHER